MSKRRRGHGGPHPVDLHVGQRIRTLRTSRGVSQEELGDMIGLTFQQIQKYERGANRVSASRLYDIGEAFNIPASFFFDQFDHIRKESAIGEVIGREELELIKDFNHIIDAGVRSSVRHLVKSLRKAEYREEDTSPAGQAHRLLDA